VNRRSKVGHSVEVLEVDGDPALAPAGAGDGTINRALHFGQATVLPAAASETLSLAPQEQLTKMGMAAMLLGGEACAKENR